jgi:hypothetical protein
MVMNIVKPYFDDEDWIEIKDDEDRVIHTERRSKYKHKITVKRTYDTKYDAAEIYNWCTDNFGEGGRQRSWRRAWVGHDLTFFFKDEANVTLFLLRWV